MHALLHLATCSFSPTVWSISSFHVITRAFRFGAKTQRELKTLWRQLNAKFSRETSSKAVRLRSRLLREVASRPRAYAWIPFPQFVSTMPVAPLAVITRLGALAIRSRLCFVDASVYPLSWENCNLYCFLPPSSLLWTRSGFHRVECSYFSKHCCVHLSFTALPTRQLLTQLFGVRRWRAPSAS
eukprot:1211935-Pleurochrysis_carterae.AAC.1